MANVTLSSLLGQPDVSTFLRGVVARGRYGNAYLFHGPAGVGKGTAALAFARAILCRDAPAPAQGGLLDAGAPAKAAPGDDACGRCATCHKAAALGHPDLRFLFPVSGEESKLEATVGETLQAMREDPLHVFAYDKAASIRLSLTRELLRELAYKPYEAGHRVVVVRDADRMREDQYSAMLKSIEEPGAATVWVLTSARPSRLPATIRSRCQRVRFAALPEALVRGFLEERAGVAPADALLLAALSSGSLSRALAMREADPAALRDQALALLEPALKGDHAGMWKTAQGFMNFGRTGRESLRRMVEFHQLWLRDLLRLRYGGPEPVLVNADRVADLRRLAEKVDAAEIRRRLMVLEEMLRAIEGNVAADVALFSGLARVSGARMGEGAWPRHATGRWDY